MNDTVNNPLPGSKPHYELLDGLRGVAAIMVVWYHFFEGFATSPFDQKFNHGYLSVDFFFVLSGFVIAYAYDDRWKKGLTTGRFLLRRVIRLQPMVVIAVILGAISFLAQGSQTWTHEHVSLTAVGLSLLLGLFMLPSLPGSMPEVRGNGEMFPLNGPSWSLFFEYIASVAYGFLLHRLSKRALTGVTVFFGILLALAAICNFSGSYHLGMGWTMMDYGFFGGLLRVGFSFSMGMLLARGFRPKEIRGAFWWCSAVIIAIVCVPYIGYPDHQVWNGVFDAVCTLAVFPFIVWLGASGKTTDARSTKICSFLGRISYPLYIIHYPAMYYYYSWLWDNNLAFSQVWPVVVCMFVGIVIVAWGVMKFYDAPVRQWLAAKLLRR